MTSVQPWGIKRSSGVTAALYDGLRLVAESVGSRSVHGFVLGKDGRLRLKASVPGSAKAARVVSPEEAPALFDALYQDVAGALPVAVCAAAVPECATASASVAAPLVGRKGPMGILLAVFDRSVQKGDVACMTVLGRAIGASMEAVREAETLARRLHASERTVNRLIGGVLDGGASGFVLDLDGRVLRWSRGAEERFGWREHDVRGSRLPVTEESATRCVLDLRAGAATESPFALRLEIRRPDGAVELVDATAATIADEDESAAAVLVVCREARAGRAAPRSLRQAYLAALVERELASPLTAIKGYAELLSRPSIAEDGAQRARVAHALSERAREIERVLKDIAVLCDLERGSGLIAESFDLGELVMSAAARVNAEQGADVFFVRRHGGSARVLMDRMSAERAFEGLLRCVARLTARSERTEVHVRADGRTVEVLLDGLARMLADGSSDTAIPDTLTEAGIGFHLARMTVEAHGGDVWLETAHAGVERIGIRLPAYEGDEEAAWLTPMV